MLADSSMEPHKVATMPASEAGHQSRGRDWASSIWVVAASPTTVLTNTSSASELLASSTSCRMAQVATCGASTARQGTSCTGSTSSTGPKLAVDHWCRWRALIAQATTAPTTMPTTPAGQRGSQRCAAMATTATNSAMVVNQGPSRARLPHSVPSSDSSSVTASAVLKP